MTDHDDEFDDFLKRRRPIFGREPDDVLEPPAELDRVVLRQAREAIEAERPQRIYHGPRWSAPLAIAATLVLAVSVVFNMMPTHEAPPAVSDVSAQRTARELDRPAAPAAGAPAEVRDEPASDTGTVVVDLSPMLAKEARNSSNEARARSSTYAEAPVVATSPPPAAPASSQKADGTHAELAAVARGGRPIEMSRPAAAPGAASGPAFRLDEKSWLAEIKRLQDAGDIAGAEAERAEYKRQHRAYAGAPDR
jgi:hypothetical protein